VPSWAKVAMLNQLSRESRVVYLRGADKYRKLPCRPL
jgi:hypothetical protein